METISCRNVNCKKKDNRIIAIGRGAGEVILCGSCIEEAHESLKGLSSGNNAKISLLHHSPREIFEHISRKVIGQDSAKRAVAHAAARHYRKSKSKEKIKSAAALLIGPTGSGKTFTPRTMAECLNVPFCEYSATDLTPNGYVGNSVADIFSRLLSAANGDVAAASKGVIFIDEIDKIARKSGVGEKDLGELVQAALLKVIEGADIEVKYNDKVITYNTSDNLFIFGGAFASLFSEKGKSKDKSISLAPSSQEEEVAEVVGAEVTADDLENYGIIREFVGRIAIIGQTKALTASDMIKILNESEGGVLQQQKELYKTDNIDLLFSDEFKNEVVEEAIASGTGARGLDKAIEKRVMDALFDTASYRNKSITLGKDGKITVNKKKKELSQTS